MRRRAATSSRGYEAALVKGTATAARYASHAEVARRYREGMDRSRAEKDSLRRMLLGLGVDVVFVPRYLSFAVRLARICRDYEMATRENLVRGLVREWEMRLSSSGVTPNPPDREVLLRICELGFGVKFGQWGPPGFQNQPKSDVRSEMSEGRREDGQMNRQERQGRQEERTNRLSHEDTKTRNGPEWNRQGESQPKSEVRGQNAGLRSGGRRIACGLRGLL